MSNRRGKRKKKSKTKQLQSNNLEPKTIREAYCSVTSGFHNIKSFLNILPTVTNCDISCLCYTIFGNRFFGQFFHWIRFFGTNSLVYSFWISGLVYSFGPCNSSLWSRWTGRRKYFLPTRMMALWTSPSVPANVSVATPIGQYSLGLLSSEIKTISPSNTGSSSLFHFWEMLSWLRLCVVQRFQNKF